MRWILSILALAASAFAQSGAITVTVRRPAVLQADQIDAYITLLTPLTVTQTQAADFLQGAGLPGRLISAGRGQTLTGVGIYDPGSFAFIQPDPTFSYTFLHTATGTDLKEMARKLADLRATKSALVRGIGYSYALSVSQRTIDEVFARSLQDLVGDAKKKADVLASAGGLRVGAVKSIAEGQAVAAVGAAGVGLAGIPATRNGDFSALLPSDMIRTIFTPYVLASSNMQQVFAISVTYAVN
jgi:hypothetical protein